MEREGCLKLLEGGLKLNALEFALGVISGSLQYVGQQEGCLGSRGVEHEGGIDAKMREGMLGDQLHFLGGCWIVDLESMRMDFEADVSLDMGIGDLGGYAAGLAADQFVV